MKVHTVLAYIFVCIACQSTFAADFRVPKKDWEALTNADREAIKKNLVNNRLMLPGDQIVGVEGVVAGAWDPVCDLKRAACDVAAVAAAASCTGAPPVIAICLVAVAAARDACRRC